MTSREQLDAALLVFQRCIVDHMTIAPNRHIGPMQACPICQPVRAGVERLVDALVKERDEAEAEIERQVGRHTMDCACQRCRILDRKRFREDKEFLRSHPGGEG